MHALQLGGVKGFGKALMAAELHDIAALRIGLQPDVMRMGRIGAKQPGGGRGAQNARDDVFTRLEHRHEDSQESK